MRKADIYALYMYFKVISVADYPRRMYLRDHRCFHRYQIWPLYYMFRGISESFAPSTLSNRTQVAYIKQIFLWIESILVIQFVYVACSLNSGAAQSGENYNPAKAPRIFLKQDKYIEFIRRKYLNKRERNRDKVKVISN